MISAIHRIGNACNSTAAVQSAFNTLRRELELLKYPTQIISRALWRVRNNDGRWHAIHMSSNRSPAQDLRSGRQSGSVTTWFKTRQSGLRAARSKNEHSYGERVVRESAWCMTVGLATSVGAAGNVPGRGSGALRLRSRDRVHLVYGRGGTSPPPVYTISRSTDL